MHPPPLTKQTVFKLSLYKCQTVWLICNCYANVAFLNEWLKVNDAHAAPLSRDIIVNNREAKSWWASLLLINWIFVLVSSGPCVSALNSLLKSHLCWGLFTWSRFAGVQQSVGSFWCIENCHKLWYMPYSKIVSQWIFHSNLTQQDSSSAWAISSSSTILWT